MDNHKEKTKKLYDHIREINQTNKENILTKINVDKEPLPEIPPEVYVKNLQKQSKTKNKYNKEKITSINKNLKTANIEGRHYNTKQKIHLSKIKRPRKGKKLQSTKNSEDIDSNPYLNPVPGPSSSSVEPPQELRK